ncbi:TetR/AcrR family transcriptional regulator [Phytomonospora endophytica]|uniref:AcrR family transcriptional regulator n=1 Tax=Phytomonospora endophytica TaxID=714109 RepID=A0A841FQ07_9ACTN|nr:TetR/AcrR family transcriptional regulator [Phytomonospora endophytica]MBB6035878.1 AcrR family transcriptional regulator [Phytomonospora endophytica]GIG71127.1 TetR family transcriptional regulator [Phytomonospora endophytica]
MGVDVSGPKELDGQARAFLDAGLRVLRADGAVRLTLRRVAEAAGTSTMGIYTRFGGRHGLLEAIYRHGFAILREVLHRHLSGVEDPIARIEAVAHGYREFALEDPALFALMFERPLADFDPSPALRAEALDATFGLLGEPTAEAITTGTLRDGDAPRTAYLLWTVVHGIVSIELTHALRSPLPGWFLDSRAEGRRVLEEGLAAVLAGLRG